MSVVLIPFDAVGQALLSSDFNTSATTSSEDLRGVEQRTFQDWDWAVGGPFPQAQTSPPLDSNELNLNLYETKIQILNNSSNDLEYRLGDYQRPTRRFPFAEF
ncbi:MAG: hypothetical protein QNJ64_00920 [Crocosphaera sp.]|nr:hypothetical protein [Crocosphaera sp.]